ncbi:MAG: APC family permease [Mycoplasmataceae bacterium]|nr:APC family permease [Mycoplasmataceae bacterium]
MSNTKNRTLLSIKHAPTKKKIGFFSAILLVISSSIGAGIFIKNREIMANVQGAIVYAIISWCVAIIGMLALAVALGEICSGAGNKNSQGIIGWVRTFNSKFTYLASKNFMSYLHLPIYYVNMPFYLIYVLQMAYHFEMPWYYAILITFIIAMWHIWITGLMSRAANIESWVATAVKAFPLVFTAIAGFVVIGTSFNGWTHNWTTIDPDYNNNVKSFSQIFLILGVFNSIPAVFFSFDGFYTTAGLQSELKKPNEMPMAMSLGVAVVSFFDILISIAMLLGSKTGSMFDLGNPIPRIIVQVMMILVAIGILGIINGVSIYSPRYYEDLIRHDEIPFCARYKNRLNSDLPVVGSCIITIFMCVTLTVCSLIGYFYWDIGNYQSMDWFSKTSHMPGILSFIDTISNWNALLAFVCITFAIYGAVRNRWTNKVKVKKNKLFLPSAIIALFIVSFSLIYVFVNTFGDLGWEIKNYLCGEVTFDRLIGAIMVVVVLFLFVAVIFAPTFIDKFKKHK